jgi:predicted ATP-grasp superfamily ATP-dependent carboligase
MTLSATAATVLIVNAVRNLHLASDSIPGESLSLGVGAGIVAAAFGIRLLRGPRPLLAVWSG